MHPPVESRVRRVYRALLRLLPFEFREEFGSDMEQAFCDEHDEMSVRRKWLDAVGLWLRTVKDLARTAPREHWDLLRQDLRIGLRLLVRDRGFAIAAILTLALGIGGTTAIFSVVNAVVFRPLPFPQPARLVAIDSIPAKASGWTQGPLAYEQFVAIRRQCPALDCVGVELAGGYHLKDDSGRTPIPVSLVSASLFRVFRASVVAGRLPDDGAERPGAPLIAVIAHRLWTSRFAADPAIVGRVFTREVSPGESRTVTVVGVLARDFVFPYPMSTAEETAWSPLQWDVEMPGANPYLSFSLQTFARLRQGASLTAAQAQLDTVARRMAATTETKCELRLTSLRDNVVGNAKAPLLAFLAAVGLLLLIACVNVANLMLARANARRQEFAVRTALGAGRFRVARQLLTESALLAVAGGGLGLVLAAAGSRAFVTISPPMPRLQETHIDLTVLAFTLAAVVFATLTAGLVPAFQCSRGSVTEALSRVGASYGTTRRWRRPLGLLATIQLGLALMLLVGAGLMMNSFVRLIRFDLGLDPTRVLAVDFVHRSRAPARASRTFEEEKGRGVSVLDDAGRRVVALNEEIVARLSAVPGIVRVGLTDNLPLTGMRSGTGVRIEGRAASGQQPMVETRSVTPGYFQALGIRLDRGRWFDSNDREGTRRVAIVNQTMARRFWASGGPIGQHVMVNGRRTEIVGVIKDVYHGGARDEVLSEIYQPHAQTPRSRGTLIVKRSVGARGVESAVTSILRDPDAGVNVLRMRSLEDLWSGLFADARFTTVVLSIFTGLAVLLALVGVHGILAYSIVQRRRELGIRAALGATRFDLMTLVIGQALRYAVAGAALGLLAAVGAGRLIRSLLFGVTPTDAFTLVSVTVLLLGAVVVAAYWPARRASGLDPVTSLRCE